MIFRRARWRLTLLYLVLFAIALGTFAVVFYVAFATVLAPDFDIGPELTNTQAADAAYRATIERIGVALAASYALVVALVGGAAWLLAEQTLRPIRDAHLRQRRFVADASHEIRSPVAAIRATAEVAAARTATPEERRAALLSILGSSEELSRLTNDLLLLARSDSGMIDQRPERADLSVIVAESLDSFADGDGTRPTNIILQPGLVVSADPDEIRRVAVNLIDNAIRYGGDPAGVRVITRSVDRDAVLEVTDGGSGIAAADLEQIFQPFYRVRADTASPGGTGLGLAIARSLATRNGGTLTATSRPGSGATFHLVLPRAR